MAETLDDVLSGEPPAEEPKGEEISAPPAQEPEQTDEQPKEDSAEAPEKAEPPEEPKADDKPPIDPEQFKGYLDEREKRQKLERERDELLKRLETQSQEPTDPISDPDGFREEMQRELRQQTFEMERRLMARFHDDWPEAEAWINEQLGQNAVLAARLQGSDNVLEDAYQLYQDHKKLEELSDVDAAKARLRAEVEAELRAELEGQKQEQSEKARAAEAAISKPSVVTTGTSSTTGFQGEQTLEDVIGDEFALRPK